MVKHKVKHGEGLVMVWSCWTARRIGFLYKIHGHINAHDYLAILQEDLYTTLEEYDRNHDEVILQQDNTRIHTVKFIQEWYWEQPFAF